MCVFIITSSLRGMEINNDERGDRRARDTVYTERGTETRGKKLVIYGNLREKTRGMLRVFFAFDNCGKSHTARACCVVLLKRTFILAITTYFFFALPNGPLDDKPRKYPLSRLFLFSVLLQKKNIHFHNTSSRLILPNFLHTTCASYVVIVSRPILSTHLFSVVLYTAVYYITFFFFFINFN